MNTALQKQENANTPILGKNVNHALQELIRLSRRLSDYADMETKSLVTQDHMLFAFTQRDKENLAERYAQASEEFRNRLNEFRSADRGLLTQLEQLQDSLKEKTQSNNELIEQIKKTASANTQATLFTVQEMGQRIFYPSEATSDGKDA